jgi:hypothetical protein
MIGSSSWPGNVRANRKMDKKASTRIVSSAEHQTVTKRLHNTRDNFIKAV